MMTRYMSFGWDHRLTNSFRKTSASSTVTPWMESYLVGSCDRVSSQTFGCVVTGGYLGQTSTDFEGPDIVLVANLVLVHIFGAHGSELGMTVSSQRVCELGIGVPSRSVGGGHAVLTTRIGDGVVASIGLDSGRVWFFIFSRRGLAVDLFLRVRHCGH